MLRFLQKKYFCHKETIDNFSWRALQTFGKQGITFLIFFLCASLLTPYDFGVYNYILAFLGLLIMFGDFGISTATSKFVAEYNVVDKKKLKLVLFNSLVLILGLGLFVTLLTIFFGEYFLGEKYEFVLYALPLLFLVPISSLYDGIYRGLKKFKELAVISVTVGLLSVFFVYFLVSQYGLIGALVSQSLFSFFLVSTLAIKYGQIYFEFDKSLVKKVLKYSGVIGVSSVSFFLYSRVDILILENYGYVKEIGYYELVNRGFQLMHLPFVLLAQVIAPNITGYFAKKDYLAIKEKSSFFMKRIIPLSIFIVLVFYFAFPELIKIFLPEYYVIEMLTAISILSFLIPAKIWGVFQTQSFIVATGFAKIIAVTTLVAGVLNVIFNIIFINWLGFVGVFWVTLIVHSLNILFQTLYYNFKIKNLK